MIKFKRVLCEDNYGHETNGTIFKNPSEPDEYYDDDKVMNATADQGFIVLNTHEDHRKIEKEYTSDAKYYPYLYCKIDPDNQDRYIEIRGGDSDSWSEELTQIYPVE